MGNSDPVTQSSSAVNTITQSTCCYCGVGCGVLIESDGEKIIGIKGDPSHPANFGRLCTKGMTLPLTAASHTNRALYPEMRINRDSERQRIDWDSALDTVAERFAEISKRHGRESVAFYISGQLLTEDYYVFNKFAKALIGTNNIDTNSRLCMSSAVTAYKLALGADGPPGCYEDLELADCVLFAGSNMAWAHPVLFRRLEEAKASRSDVKWIVIDPRRTDTAAMADLHLQIQPGTDVALFNGMLHHLIWEGLLDPDYIAAHTGGFDELKKLLRDYTPRMAAEICGVLEADLILAAEWFGKSSASLSLYCMGLNQSAHGTDKNLTLINLHLATHQIGKPGAGPFSLTGQPNAMGGREVGGMATMLAAHRDITNPEHRAEVARLWGIETAQLSATPGLPATELFDAVRTGKVKALWIACTNPVHSMPDITNIKAALEAAEFVVVQEAFSNTDTVPYADVLLPASSWGEKSGTVTNSERRISRVRQAIASPGETRPDWWIACEVARRMEALLKPGEASLFPFTNEEQIFNEHRLLTKGRDLDIGGLSYALLENQGPQQWPMPANSKKGDARRYENNTFATPDGRAQFHATCYKPVAEATNARYPFHLLTGRLRDQWHGMSRTGRVPQLFSHTPEATLSMHPDDAARRGLLAGELVHISSKRGGLVLPLMFSDEVTTGSVFVAMHWGGQFLNSGGINESTIAAVDKKSMQPELKHAAVRIERADLPWRLTAARRGNTQALQTALQPLLKECAYASISMAGEDTIIVKAAATMAPLGFLEKMFAALDLQPGDDVLEYRDTRRNMCKRVGWENGYLSGFVWAGDINGADNLLQQLINGQVWQGSRLSVFNPKASSAAALDRTICSCKQVKESAITAMLAQGADLAALKSKLACGTVCGSCVPELKRMCSTVMTAL